MVKHKKITWTAPGPASWPLPPEQRPAKLHIPYVAPNPAPDAYLEHLEVGALWHITKPLVVQDLGSYSTPPFPYLTRHNIPVKSRGFYPNTKFFDLHTPAIYAGAVRVEEDQRGRVITVLRHVFFIGDCRYIIRSLEGVAPVLEPTPSSP